MNIRFLLLPLLLVGCQSPKLSAPDLADTAPSKVAKVIVYRESLPEIGQGDLYFGEGGKSYAVFSEIGSQEISLPPGKHVFELTSKGAATFKLEVALAPDRSTCIRAYTNGTNAYGRYVFPLLRNLTSEFQAEVFPCPEKPKQPDDKTSV
jgi:hypothetical protein